MDYCICKPLTNPIIFVITSLRQIKMDKANKLILLFTYIILTSSSYAQKLHLKKLKKKHELKNIVAYTHLGYKSIFFAIHFKDSTTRLYDISEDTTSKKSYKDFRISPYEFLGKSNGYWEFLKENVYWDNNNNNKKQNIQLIGKLKSSDYDSITILESQRFAAFKQDTLILINFREDEMKLRGFYKIPNITRILNNDAGKVFVERINIENNKKEIVYLDNKYGKLLSNFHVDSIYNFPDSFNKYSLVVKDEKKMIFNYHDYKIVDSTFSKSYIVPIYNYPLILKEDSICFGDDHWIEIPFDKPKNAQFKINGDGVIALITNEKGKFIKIDIFEKKIIESD